MPKTKKMGRLTVQRLTKLYKRSGESFHKAVEAGNMALVEQYIAAGVDVNERAKFRNRTALHLAAKRNRLDVAKLLLDNGVEVNAQDAFGKIPLHVALQFNHIDMFKLLLTNGSQVNALHSTGDTPLHLSVRKQYAQLVELLLLNGADPNYLNVMHESPFTTSLEVDDGGALSRLILTHGKLNLQLKNKRGENALHLALLRSQSVEVVESLLKMSPRNAVNKPSNDGSLPLHFAIRNPSPVSLDMVRLLVKRGAGVKRVDRIGRTPLFHAVQYHKHEIIEYLLTKAGASANGPRNLPTRVPLFAALENGDAKTVYLLLDHGARVNVFNQQNDSPLHTALCGFKEDNEERYQVCLALLDKGALADHRDSEGYTPFHLVLWLACGDRGGHLADLLVARGANVSLSDFSVGDSPLQIAVKWNLLELAKRLLKEGADPNAIVGSRSAFMDAIFCGDEEMFDLLIQYGANCKDKRALIWASAGGNVRAVKVMLSRGADVNSAVTLQESQQQRVSVLEAATCNTNLPMVQYLLDNGADVNLVVDGRIPLIIEQRSFDDAHVNSQKLTMFLLLKHIARLVARDLYVDERIMKFIQERVIMSNEYESYSRELEIMKSTKVCNESSVTYLDLLTKSGNALARCLRCKRIRTVFLSTEYKTQFPTYAEQMEKNCFEELKRLEIMKNFQRLLHNVFVSVLPYDITVKISEYFCVDNLQPYFKEQSLLYRSPCPF